MRIQLDLIAPPTFFNYTDTTSFAPNYDNFMLDEDSVLNIFFVYLSQTWGGYANPQSNIIKYSFFTDHKKEYFVMNGNYIRHDLWTTLKIFRHELNHMFGLWHLWDGSETCNEFQIWKERLLFYLIYLLLILLPAS